MVFLDTQPEKPYNKLTHISRGFVWKSKGFDEVPRRALAQKGRKAMSRRSQNGKWEEEFYSSQLYRMLRQVKAGNVENTVRKAVNIAEDTVRKAEQVVDDALTGNRSQGDGAFHASGGNPSAGSNPGPNRGAAGGYPTGNPQPQGPRPSPEGPRSPYGGQYRPGQGTQPSAGGYAYGRRKRQPAVPEGMQLVRKRGVARYYITGIFSLLYALLFPLYQWYHFLAFAMAVLVVFGLSSLIFRGKWVLEPLPPKPEEPPVKKSSGNAEVDKVVEEGTDYLRRLRKADENIEDEEISDAIVRMEEISFRIFAYVCDHPQKVGQIRKFMNYYLPTTLKLLESYDRMSRQDVEGENITQSMEEIERIMHTIVLAFEKQLDALFQDEAMDISTDITVLEGMLAQEGIPVEDKPQEESPELKL